MNIYAVRRYGDPYPKNPMYIMLVFTDKEFPCYTRNKCVATLPLKESRLTATASDYYFVPYKDMEKKEEFYEMFASKRIVWL